MIDLLRIDTSNNWLDSKASSKQDLDDK
jgi:hypothetical protein